MELIDLRFFTFLLMMLTALTLSAVYYPLWGLLHQVLPQQLDRHLFRKPFFNEKELMNYQYFPLSLIRSLNYSYLIAMPGMAKRRRFKELREDIRVNPLIRLACVVHIGCALLGAVAFVAIFGYGGYLYLFHT